MVKVQNKAFCPFFSFLPYILYIVHSTHLWRFQAKVTIIYLEKCF